MKQVPKTRGVFVYSLSKKRVCRWRGDREKKQHERMKEKENEHRQETASFTWDDLGHLQVL